MAEKDKKELRADKNAKGNPNFFQKIGLFLVRTAKRLKNFFIGLKSELKRVIWPDRKRLIQSTATVLAICLIVSILLWVVDTVVGGILKGVGFYTGGGTATTTTTTTVSSTESNTTTASGETTASGTSTETTVAETSSAG